MTKQEILQAFKKAKKRYTITWLDYIFNRDKIHNEGLCSYFTYNLEITPYLIDLYLQPMWIKYRTKNGLYDFNNNKERLEAIKKVIKDLENK
jgi:hypothetical protein